MTALPPVSADLEAYVRAEHVDFRATLAALTATVLALDTKVGAVLAVAVEVKTQATLTNGRLSALELEHAKEAAVRDDRAKQAEITRAARATVLADAVDHRQAVTLSYTKVGGLIAVATLVLALVVLFANHTFGG